MLTAELVEAGADMEQTKNALQHLYDKGLLNDEPDAYTNTKRLA